MQVSCFFFQLGILTVKRPQVRNGEGMLLHRNEVQLAAALRVAAPRLPGDEEIQADAEAGLEDGEALAAAPALGQAVAGDEHVARLRRAAFGAVVDVAERLRVRRSLLEREPRRYERSAHALLFLNRGHQSGTCRDFTRRSSMARWLLIAVLFSNTS